MKNNGIIAKPIDPPFCPIFISQNRPRTIAIAVSIAISQRSRTENKLCYFIKKSFPPRYAKKEKNHIILTLALPRSSLVDSSIKNPLSPFLELPRIIIIILRNNAIEKYYFIKKELFFNSSDYIRMMF